MAVLEEITEHGDFCLLLLTPLLYHSNFILFLLSVSNVPAGSGLGGFVPAGPAPWLCTTLSPPGLGPSSPPLPVEPEPREVSSVSDPGSPVVGRLSGWVLWAYSWFPGPLRSHKSPSYQEALTQECTDQAQQALRSAVQRGWKARRGQESTWPPFISASEDRRELSNPPMH